MTIISLIHQLCDLWRVQTRRVLIFNFRIHKNDCSYKTAGFVVVVFEEVAFFKRTPKNKKTKPHTFRLIHCFNAFRKCTRTSKLSFFELGLRPITRCVKVWKDIEIRTVCNIWIFGDYCVKWEVYVSILWNLSPEERNEKAKSCPENLWNEIRWKGL